MKNITLIISLLFVQVLYSQEYPLNYEDRLNIPKGAYLKDMNGELTPYVGLWKGNWDGKIIYIQLKKVKYALGNLDDPHFMYRDRIVGERKIINANGSILIDRITNFDEQHSEFYGIGDKFSNPSQKYIAFYPKNMCGMNANLDITFLNAAKTQISLHLIYNPKTLDESCPYYNSMMQGNEPPFNFPKDIVLIKQ